MSSRGATSRSRLTSSQRSRHRTRLTSACRRPWSRACVLSPLFSFAQFPKLMLLSSQRVQRLKEQLAALVDTALPSSAKGKASAEDEDDEMDDWDLYDDEPVASTSAAGVKRNHVVFTDSLDAGAWLL